MARRRADARGGPPRQTPAPRQEAATRWKRVAIAAVVGAAVLIGGAATLMWRGAATDTRDGLPPLPDLPAQPAAVRQHLQGRYEAAEADPGSAAAVGALCTALHADMFYEQADACYARALELDPAGWRWTYQRALIRADRGGGERLVDDLRRTVQQAPDFAPAWLRLGDAEFKAGRYDRAAEAWDRAARLREPPRPDAMPPHAVETPVIAYAVTGLARISLLRGDARRAADLLEDVVSGAPAFGSAHRLLADAYTALGQTADAERALARARRLPAFVPYADPVMDEITRESRNSVLLLRMASEADLGVNAAWSEYLTRRALEFDPDNPEVVSKLGRVLRTTGRSEEALPYFQRYHQMVPGDYQGIAHLGGCLSDLGRYEEAEPLLRRALEGIDDALGHYNLALLLARTNRSAEAIAEYERALERDPNHADARVNLAASLARTGDLDGAARELTRVIDRDPENALAHTNLGLVLAQRGQTARAIAALERALQLEPSLAPAAEALNALRP